MVSEKANNTEIGIGQDSTEDKAIQVGRIVDTFNSSKTSKHTKLGAEIAKEHAKDLFGSDTDEEEY